MDATIALWLVGGGIVLGLMALFVVLIARSMDKTGGMSVKTAAASHDDDTGDHSSAALSAVFGGAIGAKLAEVAKSKQAANEAGKKAGGVVAALVGGAAAVAVGGAVAADVFGDRRPVNLIPEEITAGELHGTLLSPRDKAPVVLMVPGSGPTDRDGNSPLGVRGSFYRLLAEGLAQEGIATVRVDKRGMFGSAGAGNPNDVSMDVYANDYRAWIDTIRERTGRKCVWLLGHSEGALMVSAAAEGRKDVCGLILVSGMGRKMGDVIRAQLKANPANAPLLDQAFAALDNLEAGRHVDTSNMHPALLPLFAPQVQDFLISMLSVDPVEVLRKARVKSLIVQGTTDLQVTEQDARLLNKVRRTKMELVRGMNHVLKEAPEDMAANFATYANPDLPLHPKLVDEIEDFIKGD